MSTEEPGSPPRQLPPAGWYDDPSGSGQRWWDGTQWTEHYSPPPPEQPPAAPAAAGPSDGKEERSALVPLGYVFAIIMPFIGLILGIIAATRPRGRVRRNGPWIIAVSAVAFVVWVGLIAHAAEKSNHEAVQRVTHAIQQGAEKIEKAGEEAKREEASSEAKLKQEEQANEGKAKREEAEVERKVRGEGG